MPRRGQAAGSVKAVGYWTGPERNFNYASGEEIKSLSSVCEVAAKFHNNTPYAVEIFWLNFRSQPVSYGVVPAKTAMIVLTYITHPWVFCVPNDPEASKFLVTSDRKQVAFPSKINPDIHINMAPNLPWNLARHIPRFGENKQFMSETKNLLLAHVHLKPLHGQPQLVEPPSQPRDIPCPRSLPGSLSMSRALLLSSPRRYLKHCFSMPSTTDSPPWSPRASTGANAYSSGASGKATKRSPYVSPRTSCSGSEPVATPQEHFQTPHLGDLPLDLVLEMVKFLAPPVPDTHLSDKEEMDLPPDEILPQHEQQMLEIAAHFEQLAANQAAAAAIANGNAAGPVVEGMEDDDEMPGLIGEDELMLLGEL